MGMNGVSFDAKFAAYEKYLKANKDRLGLSSQQLGEQLGRYAVGLQADSKKAENSIFGREFGRNLAKEKAAARKDYEGLWTKLLNERDAVEAAAKDVEVPKPVEVLKTPETPQTPKAPKAARPFKGVLSKLNKFFKAHGGKFALAGLVAAGITALAVALKKDDVPKETTRTEDNITPVVPNDSTVVVPPLGDEEVVEETDDAEVVEKTGYEDVPVAEEDAAEKVAADDAEVAADESEEAAEEVAVDETEKSEGVVVDETSDDAAENEGAQKPMGLSKADGLTVAQLKGKIRENRVENKYLRREMRLNNKYERRIGAPNEIRQSNEEIQEKINENKNETKIYRQKIKDIRITEKHERKLERQAHRDIRKLEKKAEKRVKKLRAAAQKARKSGIDINETKLENDIKDIYSTIKTQTDKIYEQTEKSIEQGRLALKA